jgi:hypothetical protein
MNWSGERGRECPVPKVYVYVYRTLQRKESKLFKAGMREEHGSLPHPQTHKNPAQIDRPGIF